MTTGPLILVVEDELPARRFLRACLQAQGYRIIEAASMSEAMIGVTTHNPELVLLDLTLPDGDGLELTRRVREWSTVPVLIVSARGREADKVDALDAGADDYLTKPFGVAELFARIRTALRHARAANTQSEPVIDCGGLRVDLAARRVLKGRDELHLTPTEYRLLALLAQHVGKVLTHRQILRAVWGAAFVQHTHYVRVYMAELRRKVEDDAAQPKWLLTEPGVGYRLKDLAG